MVCTWKCINEFNDCLKTRSHRYFQFYLQDMSKKIKVLKEQSSFYFIKTKHNFACVHLYLLVLLRCNFLASSHSTCFQGLWALSGSCCTCTKRGLGMSVSLAAVHHFPHLHLLPPRTSQKWGQVSAGWGQELTRAMFPRQLWQQCPETNEDSIYIR